MASSQTNVGCLVSKVVLGKQGKMFQNRIEHHIRNCGVEWTNNRLKAIWNAALCIRSGERDKVIEIYQKNSISYNPVTLIPKGVEGVPVARFVTAQRPSVIKRQAAVLRYYCSLRLDHVSDQQRDKALTAISSPSAVLPDECIVQGIEDTVYHLGHMIDPKDGHSFQRYYGENISPSPSERHAEHLKSTSKYYSRNKVPRDLRGVPYSSMAMSFMTEPWVPEVIDEQVPCFEMREYIRKTWLKDHPQHFAGKITFLQEQGCKARVVCQPSAWLQLAFMPLHNRLMKQAEDMFPRESCVTSQVSGAYALMNHLSEGHRVFCTDLSSATDRFPRWYSIGVLNALGHEKYAIALSEVCEQKFMCSEHPDGFVRYGAGQPMGLYGSFPLFHISNMLVADAAVRTARKHSFTELTPFRDGSYFKTVGDDIIFSDERVCVAYQETMAGFGVQISASKSFQGNLGEFAGFIGLSTNQSTVVFRPYKVPDKDLNNAIQFLDALGSKVSRISPYWAKQFNRYWSTVSSRDLALDPLIPGEDVGPYRAANRGDNRTIVNLCNVIATQSTDSLPDLSGSTRINRVPLFRERGVFDFYGYNPERLRRDEASQTEPMRSVRKHIASDPLMSEVMRIEKEPDYQAQRIVPHPPKVTLENDPEVVEGSTTGNPHVKEDKSIMEDGSTHNRESLTRALQDVGRILDKHSRKSQEDKANEPSTDLDGEKPSINASPVEVVKKHRGYDVAITKQHGHRDHLEERLKVISDSESFSKALDALTGELGHSDLSR